MSALRCLWALALLALALLLAPPAEAWRSAQTKNLKCWQCAVKKGSIGEFETPPSN